MHITNITNRIKRTLLVFVLTVSLAMPQLSGAEDQGPDADAIDVGWRGATLDLGLSGSYLLSNDRGSYADPEDADLVFPIMR